MMGEMITESHLQPLQQVYKGLESDTAADISILAGDFNYRMVNEVEGEGKPW